MHKIRWLHLKLNARNVKNGILLALTKEAVFILIVKVIKRSLSVENVKHVQLGSFRILQTENNVSNLNVI